MHRDNYEAAAKVFDGFGGTLAEPAPGENVRKFAVPFVGQAPPISHILSALDRADCRTPGTVAPCLVYLGALAGDFGEQLEFVDVNVRYQRQALENPVPEPAP